MTSDHAVDVSENRRGGNETASGRGPNPRPSFPERTLAPGEAQGVLDIFRTWPGFALTPLRRLGIARELGLGAVLHKDESGRFGLRDAAVLPAILAVTHAVDRALGLTGVSTFARAVAALALHRPRLALAACGEDGFGLGVAWACRRLNLPCTVFLSEDEADPWARDLARLGAAAEVVRGGRAHAADVAEASARAGGLTLVSRSRARLASGAAWQIWRAFLGLAEEVAIDPRAAKVTHLLAPATPDGLAACLFARFSQPDGSGPRNLLLLGEGSVTRPLPAGLHAQPLRVASDRLATAQAGFARDSAAAAGVAGLLAAREDSALSARLGLGSHAVVLIAAEGSAMALQRNLMMEG